MQCHAEMDADLQDYLIIEGSFLLSFKAFASSLS